MPKTLTGEELQLDDAPARDAELFLVDGNNLAYRAYFALPEELATSEGFPTGALLGFTNMLFKLLSDYKPKGVAVAWDTRPVHRAALSEDYKSERRPMPDLLREQFPHFRPIVEAFGYRNLEFEGWEADDVIATLATRADDAGIRTCVVSTDRDAFQLVSDNVVLMMTPRGVQEVNVYTPERVEARLGVPPEKVPDLIGLKGDTSDNIAGIPGIGDKTAAELMIRYGSLEEVLEHADELSPARAKNVADARGSGARLESLGDDAARPRHRLRPLAARPRRRRIARSSARCSAGTSSAACSAASTCSTTRSRPPSLCAPSASPSPGASPSEATTCYEAGSATPPMANGPPSRRTTRWSSFPSGQITDLLQGADLVVYDAKALRVPAVDDVLIAAYLIEPGRAAYELSDLAAEYGLEVEPDPAAEEETAAWSAVPPCRSGSPRACASACRSGERRPLRERRAAADAGAGGDGGRRRQDRRLPDGRDHRPPPGACRGARVQSVRARGRGVHARLDAAGGAGPVREARPDAGPQGQDRLLDGHARPPDDPRRARDRGRARGVARADEADQHVPRPAARR